MTNIVAIIPAHLESVRFPRKILHPIEKLVMVEHVRRRALMASHLDDVYVATCDKEIAQAVTGGGGKVIMTANTHRNGTSRVAEAIESIDCSHVILLQGDEPLLLPRHVDSIAENMIREPDIKAWNATAPITAPEELDRHSFVKCSVAPNNRILYCFRRSPAFGPFQTQVEYIRKILGIIAFRKDFLIEIASAPASRVENAEYIEQMRIIENGHGLKSVAVAESLPSVNEPQEVDLIFEYLAENEEQRTLFDKVLNR